jgi:hypothetical protein
MSPGNRPVTITIRSGPTVDKDRVTMGREGDEVLFVADPPSMRFEVKFDSSTPFERDHFHNNGPDTHRTGQYDRNKRGEHKYTVKVPGHPDLDPVIIVDGS